MWRGSSGKRYRFSARFFRVSTQVRRSRRALSATGLRGRKLRVGGTGCALTRRGKGRDQVRTLRALARFGVRRGFSARCGTLPGENLDAKAFRFGGEGRNRSEKRSESLPGYQILRANQSLVTHNFSLGVHYFLYTVSYTPSDPFTSGWPSAEPKAVPVVGVTQHTMLL
jgi:hypothetical protein